MGLLWEIVQTGLMYGQKRKADTIDDRVQILEDRLTATQNTLRKLVKKLEEMQGVDIDGDGKDRIKTVSSSRCCVLSRITGQYETIFEVMGKVIGILNNFLLFLLRLGESVV